jgi:gliding motility-associated lipoprotein GldD
LKTLAKVDYYPLFKTILCCLLLAAVFYSCSSDYTPKPKGYFRINFPAKQYQLFNQPGYPYSFEYPIYGRIVKDSSFFGAATENPWWINVTFPEFNGTIHVSYKRVGINRFDKLVNDAFTMTNKHNLKASSIDDSLMTTPNNVHGLFFKVGGNVATANQFFLTDTTKHFLRGALYFDATPNEDSLGIVNTFLLHDMKHMINTFRWKE